MIEGLEGRLEREEAQEVADHVTDKIAPRGGLELKWLIEEAVLDALGYQPEDLEIDGEV